MSPQPDARIPVDMGCMTLAGRVLQPCIGALNRDACPSLGR